MRVKLDHPVLLAVLAAAGLLLFSDGGTAPDAKRRAAGSRRVGTADNPAPAPGAWAMAKRVMTEVSDNGLMTQAAAMTFYTLLSIFPALAMLVSLYGLIADPATIVGQINSMGLVLPGGAQELLMSQLKSLTSSGTSGLGWALLLSLATSLWTSNQAMKAMFNALNQVHEVEEKRSFIKLTALTLLCTAGTIVFMILALIGIVVIPAVLSFIGLGGVVDALLVWLRWPLLLVVITLLLAVLFRFGPCRSKVVWRWISWGSGFASIGWVIVSVLFSWYVANFGTYNKTYGSLGAVVGFMTWVWISSTVVLIGAQLDAELEKSTVGKQKSRPHSSAAPRVLPAS